MSCQLVPGDVCWACHRSYREQASRLTRSHRKQASRLTRRAIAYPRSDVTVPVVGGGDGGGGGGDGGGGAMVGGVIRGTTNRH